MKKIKYISKLRNESTEQVDKKSYIGLENISKNTGQLIKKNIEDVSGKANLFYKGDLLYSKLRPYLNKCVIATENGFCSTELLVLEVENTIINRYLHYNLINPNFVQHVDSQTYGTKMPRANWGTVGNFPMEVPEINIQKKVVSFLDNKLSKIDEFVFLKEKQIKLLEKQRQAMITEAVTKGLNPNVKMNDSGVEWIGEIPEHWKVTKLKYLVSKPLKYGANEAAELDDRNLPRYIRITDINARGILRKDIFVSLNLNIAKKYRVVYNDILFARSGATVGKTYIHKEKKEATFAGYLINARVDKKKCDPNFIYYFTKSDIYKSWINSSLIQATIQNVSGEKYSNMSVVLPNFIESFEISSYLSFKSDQIDKIIDRINSVIFKLKEYRQSLIKEAVTGKISIEEMEAYLKEAEKDGN